MTKKNIYRLHRTLSTIMGIPIFLWAISGLMHPLMTSFRPNMTTQTRYQRPIPTAVLKNAVPLKRLLQQAAISTVSQVHLIPLDSVWYYQVLPGFSEPARYFKVLDGRELPGGDKLYAGSLARQFLEGDSAHHPAAIRSIQAVYQFDDQYSYVNRLLPAYKVSFDRPDQIAIYVDTHNSRFAFALDHQRAVFNSFFGALHSWSWMDRLPQLKAAIIAVILLLTLFTVSLGIYLSVTTKARRHAVHPLPRARWLHRVTAIIGAFFLLAWAASGLMHALQSARTAFTIRPVNNEKILTAALSDSLCEQILAKVTSIALPIADLRLFQLNRQLWLETTPYNKQAGQRNSDLLMDQKAGSAARSRYFPLSFAYAAAGERQPDACYDEKQMAAMMGAAAMQERSRGGSPIADTGKLSLRRLTHFTAAYNFSDKILPVWQLDYGQEAANRIFIDTKSATIVKEADRFKEADALVFAFFHKHEFMAWAGKSAKDTSTVVGILLILILLGVGYRLRYIKFRYGKNSRK